MRGYVPGADSAQDLESRAKRALTKTVYDFVAGGGDDEVTMAANVAGFRRYRLLPRVLKGVGEVETSTTVLGRPQRTPLFVSPMGGQRLVHKAAEYGTAKGAGRAGVGYIASSASSITLEEIARVGSRPLWFQLYWQKDRQITADLVKRAERSGYEALVLTVDTAARGKRRRDIRNGFRRPANVPFANLAAYGQQDLGKTVVEGNRSANMVDSGDPDLNWEAIAWLRSLTTMPVLIKGVMTPEDALRAAEVGASGVILSNHGGRQLDCAPGTIEVLEDVVAAVGGRLTVVVDGGVRSATDVVVALALGADAVGIGRPVLWALACNGEDGVADYLGELVSDLKRDLALLGVTCITDLDRSSVSRKDQYGSIVNAGKPIPFTISSGVWSLVRLARAAITRTHPS